MEKRKTFLKIIAIAISVITILGILVKGIYSANDNHYVIDVVNESATSKNEEMQITEKIVKPANQQYFDSKELNYEVELKNIMQENFETQVAMVIDTSYSMGINDAQNTAKTKAKELASTWIQQNPDLKAIFCNNDDMALGVVEAVEEAKKDILVVGVDGIGEAYDSIRAGKLDATVDSFGYYMSQVATEVTLRVLAGQDIPRVTHTPQALIDKTNVDKDAKDIIGWTDPKYVSE